MGKYEIWVKFVSFRKVQPEFTYTHMSNKQENKEEGKLGFYGTGE